MSEPIYYLTKPAVLFAREFIAHYCEEWQYVFVEKTVYGFLVDFHIPQFKIIIEIDGYTYHKSKEMFVSDRQRDRIFQQHGYKVIRYAAEEVLGEGNAYQRVSKFVSDYMANGEVAIENYSDNISNITKSESEIEIGWCGWICVEVGDIDIKPSNGEKDALIFFFATGIDEPKLSNSKLDKKILFYHRTNGQVNLGREHIQKGNWVKVNVEAQKSRRNHGNIQLVTREAELIAGEICQNKNESSH